MSTIIFLKDSLKMASCMDTVDGLTLKVSIILAVSVKVSKMEKANL
jgi:hypothetical protein